MSDSCVQKSKYESHKSHTLFYACRLDGKANLGKINCDNHRQICERASIRAYPTVKYYKGSNDSKRQDFLGDEIGNLDADFIVNYINNQQKEQQQTSNVHHTTEL
ncbi:unnamed protein product [Rotaria sp. Silwood2]|nr:unnamed protein product [Rotaria sp. Silwood2]